MSIQIGDVVTFLTKNNYLSTLDSLKRESGNSISTDPILAKYRELKGNYKRLLSVTKHFAEVMGENGAGGTEISNVLALLNDINTTGSNTNLTIRRNSLGAEKKHINPPDSAKIIERIQSSTTDSFIPLPIQSEVQVIQLKQVLDACKKNRLTPELTVQVTDYLLENHKWTPTDIKMLLAVSRYTNTRTALEPTLILESLTSLVKSKPYTKRIALKSLCYLSLNSQFADDMSLRNVLEHFKFYTQENEDVEGLSFLLLHLSEKGDYLIQHPVLIMNLIMDVLEFGSEMIKSVGLITLYNIAHDATIRKLCKKLQIEAVLDGISTPKLSTAIDYVCFKLLDTKAKQIEYFEADVDLNLDINLSEDIELLISK